MHINILGYGQMAKQVAALFYLGGHTIHIWNHAPVEMGALEKQIRLLKRSMSPVSEGTISIVERLQDLEDYLTIESVVEDIEIKKSIYGSIVDKITKGYYTNTSSYSPEEIGLKVNGLHFFNPITLKLVELCQASAATAAIDEVVVYLKSFDFEIVSVKNNRGYIGNFIIFHEISSALKLIERYDYTVNSVNIFYKKMYEGRDIFTIIDIIGIDVVLAIIINLKAHDDSLYLPASLSKAINLNILGKKNKSSIREVLP